MSEEYYSKSNIMNALLYNLSEAEAKEMMITIEVIGSADVAPVVHEQENIQMSEFIDKNELIEKINQVSPELKDYRDFLCNESEFTPFQAACYTYYLILSIVENMPWIAYKTQDESEGSK